MHDFFQSRRAGVLLHPTSLPKTLGNGDLGQQAYYFVDFLAKIGMQLWQVLPLNPPHTNLSPYLSQSAHAGNPLLINLEMLVEDGWLHAEPLSNEAKADPAAYRMKRLQEAFASFQAKASKTQEHEFKEFVAARPWLVDYACFCALKAHHHDAAWQEWEPAYRDRKTKALQALQKREKATLQQTYFEQYLFHQQWLRLKRYANEKGVYLFGDLPIFVSGDSVDVWAQPEYFQLDAKGQPTVVAGVPPDYFSATGQRWGNPLYNWKALQHDNFQWWVARLQTQSELFDLLRIDHFRGFAACWEIPASSETAIEGEWVAVPGEALFKVLNKKLDLPLVAEDLGVITDDVVALREQFGMPGMKVLQFAFDGNPDNVHLLHNHSHNSVVYTGTHDNNTTLGWFEPLSNEEKRDIYDYILNSHQAMPAALIQTAYASPACITIIPMQDILAGGQEQRMNTPGLSEGNWQWRFEWEQVPAGTDELLRYWARIYGRLAAGS